MALELGAGSICMFMGGREFATFLNNMHDPDGPASLLNKVWAEHELEGKCISLSATHPFYKRLSTVPTVQPSLRHELWIEKPGATLVSERPSVVAETTDYYVEIMILFRARRLHTRMKSKPALNEIEREGQRVAVVSSSQVSCAFVGTRE